MSRQPLNEAVPCARPSSKINAAYIEEMQSRSTSRTPVRSVTSGACSSRACTNNLPPTDPTPDMSGPSWAVPPCNKLEQGGRDAIAALTGNYETSSSSGLRDRLHMRAQHEWLRNVTGREPARDAGFHPCLDADPRLSRHGPPRR